jgi:hypothetical protein
LQVANCSIYDAARLIRPTHPGKEKSKKRAKRNQIEQKKKKKEKKIKSPVDDEKNKWRTSEEQVKKNGEKWRKTGLTNANSGDGKLTTAMGAKH